MYRPKTKTEEKREKEAHINKKIKEGAGSGYQARKFDMPSSAVMQERMRKEEQDKRDAEEMEAYYKEKAMLKEQNIKSQLDAVKSGIVDSISVSGLYDKATILYDQGKKMEAAQTFWASFACGEKRAAYDLYKMFYTGDGVSKNIEIATVMGNAKSREDDRPYVHVEGTLAKTGCLLPGDALRRACSKLQDKFTDGVNDEIINIQLESFNDVIRQNHGELRCYFDSGRSLEYYMTHPEVGQEVVVSGDHCSCIIL